MGASVAEIEAAIVRGDLEEETATPFGVTTAHPLNTWHYQDQLNDSIVFVAYQCASCGRKGSVHSLGKSLEGCPLADRCVCGSEWFYPLRINYVVRSGASDGQGWWIING